MKAITWIIVSTFFLLASCKKEDCTPQAGLHGTWEWEQSVGGIGGWTLTPDSEGYTQKIVIDDIYYAAYQNDSLLFKRQYQTGIDNDLMIGLLDSTYIEVEGYFLMSYHIEDQTLTMAEQCYDCYIHTYKRKQN